LLLNEPQQGIEGRAVNIAGLAPIALETQTHAVGVIVPPPDIRAIVDKTATFVARNGPEFEKRILGGGAGGAPRPPGPPPPSVQVDECS
jgi:splicing factor 3A subunit 1